MVDKLGWQAWGNGAACLVPSWPYGLTKGNLPSQPIPRHHPRVGRRRIQPLTQPSTHPS